MKFLREELIAEGFSAEQALARVIMEIEAASRIVEGRSHGRCQESR